MFHNILLHLDYGNLHLSPLLVAAAVCGCEHSPIQPPLMPAQPPQLHCQEVSVLFQNIAFKLALYLHGDMYSISYECMHLYVKFSFCTQLIAFGQKWVHLQKAVHCKIHAWVL